MKKFALAIDGPSGAGKSSIAKALAKSLGIIYVDTGAIYRTVGLYVFRQLSEVRFFKLQAMKNHSELHSILLSVTHPLRLRATGGTVDMCFNIKCLCCCTHPV